MVHWSRETERASDRFSQVPTVSSRATLAGSSDGRCTSVVVLNDFTYVQGGASRVAIDEALSLAAAGLQVILVGAVGPVAPELVNSPVRVFCLGQPELLSAARNPGVMLQSMWNREARRAVAGVLSSLDPATTVIHLHGYTKALSASPLAPARAAGFPIVCTLHDFFAACPNGAFFDYPTASPCTRRALSADCITAGCDKRHQIHKMFRVVRGAVQRYGARFPAVVDDYIVLSARSRAILQPYLPSKARLHAMPHGIDVERRPPVDTARNRVVLHIGRLDEEKGVRLLAQAAATLSLPVLFVGDGPLRAEIEAMPGMSVTGWLPAAEAMARLDDARCLVFPSLWYETFGLVVDEAAARGIPAIVSDVTAPSERVVDGEDGWLFRSGDRAALAAALGRVRDDATVARAGRLAYAHYWQRHVSARDHAAALRSLYDSILQPASLPAGTGGVVSERSFHSSQATD